MLATIIAQQSAVGVAVFRVDGERQVRVVRLHAQFGSSSRCIPG